MEWIEWIEWIEWNGLSGLKWMGWIEWVGMFFFLFFFFFFFFFFCPCCRGCLLFSFVFKDFFLFFFFSFLCPLVQVPPRAPRRLRTPQETSVFPRPLSNGTPVVRRIPHPSARPALPRRFVRKNAHTKKKKKKHLMR